MTGGQLPRLNNGPRLEGGGYVCESVSMRPIQAELLSGSELYREVVLEKLLHARESVWIATANVKAMYVESKGRFVPLVEVLDGLSAGGLELKVCPRVHFKAVVVDGAWAYLGSANLTGAGLGAKGDAVRNFELGFVTEDFDVIDRVTALYEAVWSGAECRGCKLRAVCPDPIIPAPVRSAEMRSSRDGVRLGKTRRLKRHTSESRRR